VRGCVATGSSGDFGVAELARVQIAAPGLNSGDFSYSAPGHLSRVFTKNSKILRFPNRTPKQGITNKLFHIRVIREIGGQSVL
jgi:hypothetical protein